MEFSFFKYSAAGNDFILVEDDKSDWASRLVPKTKEYCQRRLGIGADGLIFMRQVDKSALRLEMYNPDGGLVQLCANATCSAIDWFFKNRNLKFPLELHSLKEIYPVEMHEGHPWLGLPQCEIVEDIKHLKKSRAAAFVQAGVPHGVFWLDEFNDVEFENEARPFRHNPLFPEGANIHFLAEREGKMHMRCFERGVEAETWACGTGALASAKLLEDVGYWKEGGISLQCRGGEVRVEKRNGLYWYWSFPRQIYQAVASPRD